jgi:hypothetical protein
MENRFGRDTSSFFGELEFYSAFLWGMPTNHGCLYQQHIDPFLNHVLELLRDGKYSCNIVGTTSKDGPRHVNEQVAKLRQNFVYHWLRQKDPSIVNRLNRYNGVVIQPAKNVQPASKWHGVRIRMGPFPQWYKPSGEDIDS